MRWFRASLLLLMLAGLVPAVPAQEKAVRKIPSEGTEVFCHILLNLGLQPITRITPAELDPRDTLVIVLGQPDILGEIQQATAGFAHYLRKGGNLFIATDHACTQPDLSLSIQGESVGQHPSVAYRGKPRCPWLTYHPHLLIVPETGDLRFANEPPDHPLFQFLNKGIATNCPSYLVIKKDQGPLHALLSFVGQTDRAQRHGSGTLEHFYDYMAGSPKDAPPRGRALVIAGHGMFMNGMMMQADNDNFDFTVNALKWLRAKKAGHRSKALLVVDGKIITDFDANLAPPLPIPTPPITTLNRLLRGLEDERFFHRLLASLIDPDRAVALILGLGTFALLLYGVKKFMEGRSQQETAVPLLVGPQAATGSSAPLLQQRQQDLIRRNNYWQEARFLIQQWLREQFGIAPEPWIGGRAAVWQVQDGNQGAAALRALADYVMGLATAVEPTQVSERQFLRLGQALTQLQQALRENHLALLVEGKKVRHL